MGLHYSVDFYQEKNCFSIDDHVSELEQMLIQIITDYNHNDDDYQGSESMGIFIPTVFKLHHDYIHSIGLST